MLFYVQNYYMEKNKLAFRSMPRHRRKACKTESFFTDLWNNERSVNEIIFANLIVFSAIILAMFIPLISIGLPILVFLYLQVGLWGFVKLKESDQRFSYENLFVHPKILIKVFCLAIIKLFSFMFWTLCLIVPGIIYLLNYCFCPIILFESPDLDVKGVMMLSKELVYGYRLKIFFFFLFCLASICVAMSFMFSLIMFFDIFLDVSSVVYIVLVVFAGVLSLITLALPLFEVVVVDSYISSKKKFCSNNWHN